MLWPSCIWCRDSNRWSLEHKSPPITTRPGLPPKYTPFLMAVPGLFSNDITNFTVNKCKITHLESGAGIRTHNLLNMKFGCSLCVATRPIILAYFCYLVSKPFQQKNYLAWAIAVKTVSRLCCNLTFWRFNTQVPHNKTPLLLIPVNMILNTFHFKGSQIGFDAFYFHQHLCCCSASFLHLRLSSRNCLKNNFILHFRDFQHTFINNTNH